MQISIGRHYNSEKKTATGRSDRQFGEAKFTTPKTSEKLADEYNISPRSVHNYAEKATKYEQLKQEKPELAKSIDNGEKTFIEITREETKKEQAEKRKEQIEQIKNLEADGKIAKAYDVIVIDPPWKMKKIDREVTPEQTGFDYPTMNIEEISKLHIPARENAHIFLWITQKHLPAGFKLFNDWNVNYIFTMVWHKNGGFQPFNLPQYNNEFIIYGRIGTPKFIDTKAFFTCFNAKRNGHSVKPIEFYDLIRRVTAGNRIDMFARREIDGFDSWGGEI